MKSSLNNPVVIQDNPVKRFTSSVLSGNNGYEMINGTDTNDKQFIVTSVYLERLDYIFSNSYPVVRIESDGNAITEDFDLRFTVSGKFHKLNILNETYMVPPLNGLGHGEVAAGDLHCKFRWHISGFFIDAFIPE